jgi:hypothetical protein
MIIINTTFHVEDTIKNEFVEWLRNTYKPRAMASGIFTSPSLSAILADHGDGASAYAYQMQTPTLKQAIEWHDNQGDQLRREMSERWGQRALFFTTYLETID